MPLFIPPSACRNVQRVVSRDPVQLSFYCLTSLYFVCLQLPVLLCFPGQLSHLPYSFWR